MDKLEAYREKLDEQLKEWKVKIEMLEKKAADATGETKTELIRAIGELRQKKEVLIRTNLPLSSGHDIL